MLTERQYKEEFLSGLHQTEYNKCRFAEDKLSFCKQWIYQHCKSDHWLVKEFCNQKLNIAMNQELCNELQAWTDKIAVIDKLHALNLDELLIPSICVRYVNKLENLQYIVNKPYIIKCNHGSGWNNIVTTETDTIHAKIDNWLTLNYAYICGYEAQYEHIAPGYIVQPLLCDKPIDYSFWCKNGDIVAISMTKKLGKNLEQYLAFVDEQGKPLDWYIGAKPEMSDLTKSFRTKLDILKPYVIELAKQFELVRIDMYCVNDKAYFGETTFTPCGGNLQVSYV